MNTRYFNGINAIACWMMTHEMQLLLNGMFIFVLFFCLTYIPVPVIQVPYRDTGANCTGSAVVLLVPGHHMSIPIVRRV